MRSVSILNVTHRPSTRCTWNAPSASPLRLSVSGSSNLCTYPGSALTLRLDHPMSAAVVKANWLWAYPGAVLVRPAVMFGPDDTFLTVIVKLLQTLPADPTF